MSRAIRPSSSLARLAVVFSAVLALLIGVVTWAPSARADTVGSEQYRPADHYSPAQNWMNDPNGLIYYHGIYHMFYQYNKYGTTGGNASWGHAISSDLIHWTELPVAIPVDNNEEVWSGSVVYDRNNTSGLGTTTDGPLIAIYTSAVKDGTGYQRQSIAYSNDGGTTWTKYANNPVIDIHSVNFRDPKVFWYAPANSWRMVVALSDQHKVAIYSSPNLINWTEQSEFGPLGDTSSVWECPDLFPMAVDGNPNNIQWVLTVNVAGKAQYFVGNFDGTSFTAHDGVYTPPAGNLVGDGGFEGSSYGDWTTTGTAFGSGPAHSDAPTNNAVGNGWVDSYGSADSDTGTLTSPTFTINQNYINFLMAGGNHPYIPGGLTAPPDGTTVEDFEGDSLPGWTGTGDFVGITPTKEIPVRPGGDRVSSTPARPDATAQKERSRRRPSPINARYLDLLTAGGQHPLGGAMPTAVAVLVNGTVVGSVTGNNSGSMNWQNIDLAAYQGQQAQVQVIDQSDGSNGWGHIIVDNPVLSNTQATGWANETGANLIVNGQIVRTATGNYSPSLDWSSWNVSRLEGTAGPDPDRRPEQRQRLGPHHRRQLRTSRRRRRLPAATRAHWIDWGSDFYAAVSYNDAPNGKRIEIGWMNNWNYANTIPESPWRGAMALPRELSLTQTADGIQLVQQVVSQAAALAKAPSYNAGSTPVTGTHPLPAAADGQVQRIDLTLTPGTATQSGITVLGDGTTATIVGYDATAGTVYIDRRNSGDTSFNSSFPTVDSAPVQQDANGNINLTVYLDRSSVEVFAQGGQKALTDLVFPNSGADQVDLFANGGSATVQSLTVTPLAAAMFQTPFTTTPAPTITGTTATGATLTAVPGAWAPQPGWFTYQWQADDIDVSGATGSTFVPTAAQVGKRLTVTVTAHRIDYEPYPVSSASTAPVTVGFTLSPAPTISGTAAFGHTLTAITGTWSPRPRFSYQWYADGTAIQGATGRNYKLGAAALGKRITVAVTGTKTGLTTVTQTSAPTDPVATIDFPATPSPTISGNPVFGTRLYASAGSWQTSHITLRYQWSAGGTAISGATGTSYVPTADVIGKTVTVSVTGSATGYNTVTKTSAPTAAVQPATFAATPTPTISGTTVYGHTLYGSTGSWQTTGVTFTYQWYADGNPIAGATKSTYAIGATVIGTHITLAATGSKTGYTTVTESSAATAPVTASTFTSTPTPVVTGTPKVGSTLAASPGTWRPSATFAYQWYANGAAINGATTLHYKLTAAEFGKTITVAVTGSRTGYTTVTKASVPSSTVTQ